MRVRSHAGTCPLDSFGYTNVLISCALPAERALAAAFWRTSRWCYLNI